MYIKTLKITITSLVLYVILKPWDIFLTNIVGYFIVLSTLFLPISYILEDNGSIRNTKIVLLNALLIISIVISLITSFNEDGIDIELLKSLVGFISMYLTISFDSHTYKKRDAWYIFILYKILSVVFIAYTLLPFPFRYTLANQWGYYAFTLSMGNTNATAIQVFVCIIMLGIEIKWKPIWKIRIINFVLICFLFYTLFLLQCRTIMLCSILFVAFLLFDRLQIHKWMVVLSIIIPIIAFWMQMGIKEDNVTILGKGIVTGRDEIYVDHIQSIIDAPYEYLFGQLCVHRLNNYHNGPFALLMNIGLIGSISCVLIWGTVLNRCIESCSTPIKNITIFALLLYLIHSSTEAAPMMGMLLYGTPVVLLFRMGTDTFENDENTNKCTSVQYKYIKGNR